MSEKRLIPLLAVFLVVCLGATCVVALIGTTIITQESTVLQDPLSEFDSPASPGDSGDSSMTEEDIESLDFPTPAPGEQSITLPGGDPPTLDPHLSGDATSARYVVEIYSGLVTYDQDLSLIPDLAREWDVSDDGLVYTFYLREGATFHNGKPVRAQDFQWSFERACDFRTGSSTADTYLGDIIGCRDKLRGQVETVSGIEVLDDYTLQLTITEPKAYFLDKMTYPTAYVLDRENVERGGRTWTNAPNGTGPFRLENISFGEAIVLARNENYYREPMPQLYRINFTLSGGSAMIRYENDEISMTPVSINDLDRVTDPANPLNADLEISTRLSVFYLGFNVNQPPFDDPLVRRAFNMALDKEKIVSVVYKESVPVAQGIVPPGIPGYDNPDLDIIPFDPEGALDLIYDSTYGDPSELPEVTLYTTGAGGSPARITEAIIASYKEVFGIDVAIQQTDWSTFLADLSSDNNPYQVYQVGWIADYPDPQNFLEILFHSESRQNYTGYGNPDLDALLDEAGVETDPQRRLDLYQQAEQLILDDAPWVPLYFDTEYWLVKPNVRGFTIPPMIIPTFQYVSVGGE